jgi:hypothetical protein
MFCVVVYVIIFVCVCVCVSMLCSFQDITPLGQVVFEGQYVFGKECLSFIVEVSNLL